MRWTRLAILLAVLSALLSVPLAMSPRTVDQPGDALSLIVITPHNEQIRSEFGRAFDRWHREHFGRAVTVAWSTPGGTTEIVRMLQAQYKSAILDGRPPGGAADLVFGGGTREHGQLKRGIEITTGGGSRWEPISTPVDFSSPWLGEIYGENTIGDGILFDPDHYWFGLALSGFGIVFNRQVIAELHVPEPSHWDDVCDPRLQGWVALVNPGQSGSIATAFEAILQRRGWTEGWRILRRAAANARYFSATASKAPIDVSLGDAAVGICIDFFGRYQAQAVMSADAADIAGSRVGYVDPPGETSIDADPISMLRGAPHAEVARRFIEFCLSEQGQALWQFRARDPQPDGMGPARFELRRLPIRRAMYEKYLDRMVDRVNPFEIARRVESPNKNMRAFVAPLFSAMAMDNHARLRQAWAAIVNHAAYPTGRKVVTANDVTDAGLRRMLELFDAMPESPGPDGQTLAMDSDAHLAAILQWWSTRSLWPAEADGREASRLRYTAFFADKYEQILRLAAHQPES